MFRVTDVGKLIVLFMLEFSKALDTLQHDVLLAGLHYIGLSNSAVLFFQSYLGGRTQCVLLAGSYSCKKPVSSGIPPDSILAPILYTVYNYRLCSVFVHCKYHLYTDYI